MNEFITKDSGARIEYESGMRRDVDTGKPRYDLIDRAFLKRWAELMARGAEKYGDNNWRLACTEEELARFQGSALRHTYQWLDGDTSEDHAAAIAFNVAAAEFVKQVLGSKKTHYATLREQYLRSYDEDDLLNIGESDNGVVAWEGHTE